MLNINRDNYYAYYNVIILIEVINILRFFFILYNFVHGRKRKLDYRELNVTASKCAFCENFNRLKIIRLRHRDAELYI